MRWLAYFFLLSALPAAGAEVLRVGSSQQVLAVSQDESHPWQVGDRLCVFDQRSQLECGGVTKATSKLAIVRLDAPNDRVLRGARVRSEASKTKDPRNGRAVPMMQAKETRDENGEPSDFLTPPPLGHSDRKGPPNERRPAAKLLTSYDKVEGVENPGWNLSGGISAGFTFFFPMIQIQKSIGSYCALGLMPVYFRASASTSSVGAFGGVMTFSYYGNEYFRGLWTQLGVGAYQFSAETATISESALSPVLLGTIGWRGYWDLGLNVGLGAGLQYVVDPSFASAEVKAVNVQPVFVLDVGVNF